MAKKKGPGAPEKIGEKEVKEMRSLIIAQIPLTTACSMLGFTYRTWHNYEKAHPEIFTERKQWEGTLKTKAKLNVADAIINKRDLATSVDYLQKEDAKELKNAKQELTRAQAKKVLVETEIVKRQAEQVNAARDESTKKMKELSIDDLRSLAHLADGVDIDGYTKD